MQELKVDAGESLASVVEAKSDETVDDVFARFSVETSRYIRAHAAAQTLAGRQAAWRAMYAGAFAALNILNPAMILALADLTRASDEATTAIGIMRDARAGDRVWPALEWLRARRRVGQP